MNSYYNIFVGTENGLLKGKILLFIIENLKLIDFDNIQKIRN
jgi:hypothetical protein